MVDSKRKIVLTLTLVLAMALVVPVSAVNYNPGVTVGQYVKYGNFSVTVNGSETGSQFDWTKVEVTAVVGKEVSLRTSGQFKNGTATPGSGSVSVYNIQTGKLNGTTDYTYGPIIAGNLSEGDAIPPLAYGFVVNKTETRTYSGVNRTVNIIDTTYSDPSYGNHWTLVYDKISGIMLESGFEYTQKVPALTTTKASYSVVETDIFALTGASMWSKTYGGTGDDTAVWVIQTSDGGYAMLGYTNSFGAGGYDYWLVKTDASGNMLWNKTYGGTGREQGFTVVQTGEGGFLMAGTTNSFGAGSTDGWLVKTDANGNMQWNKTYGTTAMETANYVIQTSDGGYAVMGLKLPALNAWVFKIDANGNMQWNKTYAAAGEQMGYSIVQTNDGGYAIAGYVYYSGLLQAWLAKTNSSGDVLWDKKYGDNTWMGSAHGLVQTADGGYVMAGYVGSYDLGASVNDGWLFKTDANGNMQWNKTYGGAAGEEFMRIVRTLDDGFAISGLTNSYGAGGSDVWVVKTDSSGNMQWNQTYGGSGIDNGQMLRQTSDGGYAIVGNTASFGAGGNDFYLVKVDASGVVPESLTCMVIMLLSSVAAVAGTLYFRKPPRIAN